jgi:hypothetical protein
MPTIKSPIGIYGEFVKKPYFVIVHSRLSVIHDRFDRYAETLPELMLIVLRLLSEGRPGFMEQVSELDAVDLLASSHRSRRYVAKRVDDLYPAESSHLEPRSVEFSGYWIGTNADKTQARTVVELACKAACLSYASVRKLPI